MQTNLREEELFCALLVKRGDLQASEAKRLLRELNARDTEYGQISGKLVSENLIEVEDVARIEEFRQKHIILCDCGKIFNVENQGDGNTIVCGACKMSHTVPDRSRTKVRMLEPHEVTVPGARAEWIDEIVSKKSRQNKREYEVHEVTPVRVGLEPEEPAEEPDVVQQLILQNAPVEEPSQAEEVAPEVPERQSEAEEPSEQTYYDDDYGESTGNDEEVAIRLAEARDERIEHGRNASRARVKFANPGNPERVLKSPEEISAYDDLWEDAFRRSSTRGETAWLEDTGVIGKTVSEAGEHNYHFDGAFYRKLHSDEALRTVYEGGKIQDVYIELLDLSKLEIRKPVSIKKCLIGDLRADGALFKGTVTLDGCVFLEKPKLEEAIFGAKTSFKYARFVRGADFSRARFDGETLFSGVKAEAYLGFRSATFVKRVSFAKGEFIRGAGFDGASFQDEVTLSEARAGYRVHFTDAHFEKDLTFSNSEWADVVDFSNATIRGQTKCLLSIFQRPVKFYGVNFEGPLSVKGTSFKSDVLFQGATFEGLVDFESADFDKQVFFQGVKLGKEGRFIFAECSARRFVARFDLFHGNLDSERRSNFRLAESEYGFLKSVYGGANDYENEDRAYYFQKVMNRRANAQKEHAFSRVRQFCNWLFLDRSCGYGTKPVNILVTFLLLPFLFAPIYFLGGDSFILPDEYRTVGEFGFFDALFFSFQTLANGSITEWHPAPSSIIPFFAGAESLLGIFLVAIMVVTFSRKVIR
ncbi:MAG: pentapeptide repeat-containing protein [Planctomycetes bacterium]|nr:pentapeptide repeat-containing protein [Planctomycetota bacterium]